MKLRFIFDLICAVQLYSRTAQHRRLHEIRHCKQKLYEYDYPGGGEIHGKPSL